MDPRVKSLEDEIVEFIKGNPDKKIIGIHPIATIPGAQGATRETEVIMGVLYEEDNKIEK
jgi:hypothetical protein